MAILRYVRDPLKAKSTDNNNGKLQSTVRSIRAVYETDPAIAQALLPKPFTPIERPEIFVQFAHVKMHVSPERTIETGAATVAVRCLCEGTRGAYVIAMPMEGEFIVIKGRETYGEPKKIAKVDFDITDDQFRVAVNRHDIPFLEIKGKIGASKGPAKFEEHFFCHKAQPDILRGPGFDGDVFLTQLDWKRNYTDVREAQGEIILRESPWDPLIDVPVRKLVSVEYATGSTQTSGKILRTIPDEWLSPFIHQRYDDRITDGLEVNIDRPKGRATTPNQESSHA